MSRKLIAAVKNGEYDEAFRVHQEALWLITHKLAKVNVLMMRIMVVVMTMMMIMMIMIMMIRVHQEALWLINQKFAKVKVMMMTMINTKTCKGEQISKWTKGAEV